MKLIDTMAFLTTRTPNGGGFWLGNNYVIVHSSADSWEWEYRGNSFYDLQDLAEEVIRRSGAGSRLVRFYTEVVPDGRREARG